MPKRKKTEGRNSVDLATDFYSNPNANLVSFEHPDMSEGRWADLSADNKTKTARWGEHADYEYEAARQTTDAPGVGEAGNIKMKVDVTDYTDEYIKNLSSRDANIRAWEGLSHEAKLAAIEVSKKLKDKGKTIIHSGYRSESQSKEDMQRVGNLNIYKQEWRDALTTKKLKDSDPHSMLSLYQKYGTGLLDSKPGSKLRKIAVQEMWDAGFRSRHGNRSGVGNAFDISYPGMPTKWKTKGGKETIAAKAVRTKLGTPKIKITPEGSPLHIHIQLKKPHTHPKKKS
jgi:hypothetical protein